MMFCTKCKSEEYTLYVVSPTQRLCPDCYDLFRIERDRRNWPVETTVQEIQYPEEVKAAAIGRVLRLAVRAKRDSLFNSWKRDANLDAIVKRQCN